MKKSTAWILYDFGNSAFATTVVAGFFPLFFKKFWSADLAPEVATARLGLALGVSGLIMAILAPVWGRKSDLSSNRKRWLAGFALMGILGTAALSFVPMGQWWVALGFFVLAYIGFEASLIFYDSLLPDVAEEHEYESVSSQGFAFGYLGGGLLFVLNVLMTLSPASFGLSSVSQAVQLSFLTVALWWGAGTAVLYFGVSENVKTQSLKKESLFETWRELKNSFRKLFQEKQIFYFLLAYWFYIDGVYTVFTMAVDYGLSLGLEQEDLMKALILTQFVGFPSALVMGKLSRWFPVKKLLLFCLFVYSLVLIYSTQMKTGFDFMVLAACVGIVQGGVQALSRSYFTHLIDKERAAEYFGFYNIIGKTASFVGPVLVGLTALLTQNSRLSLLSVIILFLLGAVFLMKSTKRL